MPPPQSAIGPALSRGACVLAGCLQLASMLGGRSYRPRRTYLILCKGRAQPRRRRSVEWYNRVPGSALLEAAFWCFQHTECCADAVLAAANLGDDADTTAAIVGQLAGAYYGVQGIPAGWLEKLWMRDEIQATADALLDASQARD